MDKAQKSIDLIQLFHAFRTRTPADYFKILRELVPAWKGAFVNLNDDLKLDLTRRIRNIHVLNRYELFEDPEGFKKDLEITSEYRECELLMTLDPIGEAILKRSLKRKSEATPKGGAKKRRTDEGPNSATELKGLNISSGELPVPVLSSSSSSPSQRICQPKHKQELL